MPGNNTWRLLPPDLVELQLGQIDLLLAMYPDEVIVEEDAQRTMEKLREPINVIDTANFMTAPIVPATLQLPIESDIIDAKSLHLDLFFHFTVLKDKDPEEPPPVKVRIQQPSWLSKAATSQLTPDITEDQDLLSMIEHIKETAAKQLENSSSAPRSNESADDGPLVRVWFYFPSISTRSKRDDFIKYAPSYNLTGFLYAGKPGLLCVEGESQSIDDYMKFIKTESWGDIPAHHKKVSERYRKNIEKKAFPDMTETTDTVGERRGQRANRGDMKAMEEWLVERGLGDAFAKVLM